MLNRPLPGDANEENGQAGPVAVHHGQVRSDHEVQDVVLHVPNAGGARAADDGRG